MMRTAEPSSARTNWSMIFDATHGEGGAAAEAREQLARRYWPAVYAFIRRTGYDVHDASDLTQGFVCDVMIGRRLFHKADPKRGRFRTLLLTALRNYLRETYRNSTRAVRSNAGKKPIQLKESALAHAHGGSEQSPEAEFSAQWTVALLRQVLLNVKQECVKDGLAAHWDIFESRVIRPMLVGDKPVPYSALVERLGLTDAAQAANMMITVKRRFARALYVEIGTTVNDPMQTDDEVQALLRDLERK